VLLKQKPKNRRLGREYVLDVKLRSSHVRQTRIRLAAMALAALFGTVFGLYLLYRTGDWLLGRLLYKNNAFAIQKMDVQTDGVIAVDQLCRWAGLRKQENLLALDLARVKRNLELVPLIESVSVERVLPRTLRIRVSEREAVAQVSLLRQRAGGGMEATLFQLDPYGYAMLPLETLQRASPLHRVLEPLPDIFGLDPRELQPGRRIEAPQLQAALQLIVSFEQSSMAGLVDLKAIDISAPQILTLKTGQASEIVFGLNNLEQQLRRWHAVHQLGQRIGKAIATLDLAVTNSIPVVWQDQNSIPPGSPKLPKPLRAKRKHV